LEARVPSTARIFERNGSRSGSTLLLGSNLAEPKNISKHINTLIVAEPLIYIFKKKSDELFNNIQQIIKHGSGIAVSNAFAEIFESSQVQPRKKLQIICLLGKIHTILVTSCLDTVQNTSFYLDDGLVLLHELLELSRKMNQIDYMWVIGYFSRHASLLCLSIVRNLKVKVSKVPEYLHFH
jgi:hypothetical protein